ncbi:MAG: 6-phosphogluconolactonase, partial [Ginsengibacter sp.]
MQLHVYKDPEELSEEVAKWMCKCINESSKEKVTIALSGGSTPDLLYRKLASTPYRDMIRWNRLHIFWGDERAVPFNDERNNAKMAFDSLLSHVDIPAANIHVMQTNVPLEEAVADYERVLHTYFNEEGFDLVLLGMGEDGHTLSLFPGSTLPADQMKWVNAVPAVAPAVPRITLMPELVNRSSEIAFLVTGSKKAKTLYEVIKGKYQPEKYPAQLIQPVNHHLHWFIDEDAA